MEKNKQLSYSEFVAIHGAAPADEVIIGNQGDFHRLDEGKWVKGDFDREIRVDRATHLLSGEKHAHIHDRKGNELYALTQKGGLSHGTKSFKLSKGQADALLKQGFHIPTSRIVEGILIGKFNLLLG